MLISGPPSIPQLYGIESTSHGSVVVLWKEGFDMGHTQTIHIEIRPINSEWSEYKREYPSAKADEDTRNTTVTGLESGTTYYLRLFASNAMGRSLPSTTLNITIGRLKEYHTVVYIIVSVCDSSDFLD